MKAQADQNTEGYPVLLEQMTEKELLQFLGMLGQGQCTTTTQQTICSVVGNAVVDLFEGQDEQDNND